MTVSHQLGTLQTAPRTYRRHMRHAKLARKTGDQFNKFLSTQATRLTTTAAVVFARIKKYSANRVAKAVNLAAIP